jgi:dienelactone hydrolase
LLAFVAAAIIILDAGASPAASPAPSSPLPDGTYTYEFRQGTTNLGTATIAVARAGGGVKTHEIVTLSGRSFTIDMTLDPTSFVPQTLDGIYPGAKPTPIHVKFGSSAFDETIPGMGSKSVAAAEGAKGIAPLDGPVMSGFFLAPVQASTTGSTSFSGFSPGSETMIPVKLAPADVATRPASVTAADNGYLMTGLQSGDITIWYDANTFVPQDLEVPAQSLSIVLVKKTAQGAMHSSAPPTPKPLPTTKPQFESRDVTFKSGDGTVLAGTLTIPAPQVRKAMPAVVLVHGSGPATRDEQIGPNPIFLQLSNYLSNHGYVVLRYDKRGIGKSGGNANTTTRDQLLADARAAIVFVASRPGVDPHDVFVLGHSEGGELAPSLAAGGAKLRGIALMAPPAIPLDQILMQQATFGLTGADASNAAEKERQAITSIRTGLSVMPGAIWLRSSFGIDPAVVITKVPCPILILQGGKDIQVLAKDLPRLVNAARAAHRDVTVVQFPNDDHIFITVPGSQKSTLAEYMVPHRVDPAMTSVLLTWLDDLAFARGARP